MIFLFFIYLSLQNDIFKQMRIWNCLYIKLFHKMALIFCRPDMTSIYLYDEINSPASCRKIKSYVLFFILCYFVYIYTYIYIYTYMYWMASSLANGWWIERKTGREDEDKMITIGYDGRTSCRESSFLSIWEVVHWKILLFGAPKREINQVRIHNKFILFHCFF